MLSSTMDRTSTDPKFNFDAEELHWPEVKPHWDLDQVLEQDGMFKFSKVKDLLGMESIDLTKLSRIAEGKGLNTYEVYGFGKPYGSQYILKMSRFRETYDLLRKDKALPTNVRMGDVQGIPSRVKNANQLIKLRGIFRFSAVCLWSPFSESEIAIKKLVRNTTDQERAMRDKGCWYDSTKREFFVDMEPFINWFFEDVWM